MLTAFQIRQLMHQTFQRQALILVPECNWTGHECDLLVVHKSMRIIDVEIKISRADFKRDAAKDKWWHRLPVKECQERGLDWWTYREHDDWPRKVWKHYFAMPREIWKPELVEFLPSPMSGVILIDGRGPFVERMAKPCKDAQPIAAKDAIDIARLANLRMWDAMVEAQILRADAKRAAEPAIQCAA
jgi:hypothetical protein